MLEEEAVQRFVDRICDNVHFNVNVMNARGVIIASRDAHRKGAYHALARDIVDRGTEVSIAHAGDDLPPGVLPGVNLAVRHAGAIIGVVGVTGDHREVESVAHALRTSLETFIEYEAERQLLHGRSDRTRLFTQALLYDPSPRGAELVHAMQTLGYDPAVPRVAILIRSSVAEDHLLATVKRCPHHTRQDVSLTTGDGDACVFKAVVRCSPDAVSEELTRYCAALHACAAAAGIALHCWCGSVQREPSRYRSSLKHARWLAARAPSSNHSGPAVFYDYCLDYALVSSPREHVSELLVPVEALLEDEHRDLYLATFDALNESNLSVKGAATRLGVHRNTVVLRLQRLRDTLGIDPVNRSRDRKLLEIALAVHRSEPLPPASRLVRRAHESAPLL